MGEQEWFQADGSDYSKLFTHYEPKEMGRQRYIENIVEGRNPSFGYLVLANLMASKYINTVITTNFDDLIYSASTTYTDIRPIVYAYGVLASEMRITASRPKILKLHGDYLYSALKNTDTETAIQDPNMTRQVSQVLNEYGLVVVGYSGWDCSIMSILSKISEKNDLYWCLHRGSKLNEAVERLLSDKRGFLIEIEGFDQMMNEIRQLVGFDVRAMIGSTQKHQDQVIANLRTFAPRYSGDILTEIAEALQDQAAEQQKQIRKIQALDLSTKASKSEDAQHLEEAERLYRSAIELSPTDPYTHTRLAHLVEKDNNRRGEAEDLYRKAIELDPKDALVHSLLANLVAGDQTRKAEAEDLYRKAIELDPKDAFAHSHLADLLAGDQTRKAEAEDLYRKAIELDPKYAYAHSHLANLVAGDQTRKAEAEDLYRKAIELDPKDVFTYVFLANLVAEDQTRKAEAEDLCCKAIELDPNSVGPHLWLGAFYYEQGNFSAAINEYEGAIRIDPNDWYSHNSMGWTLLVQGQLDLAQHELEKAINLDPSQYQHYFNLGLDYAIQGKDNEARTFWRKALANYKGEGIHSDLNHAILLLADGSGQTAVSEMQRILSHSKPTTRDRKYAVGILEQLVKSQVELEGAKQVLDMLSKSLDENTGTNG